METYFKLIPSMTQLNTHTTNFPTPNTLAQPIYHAFHEKWLDVNERVPKLAALGYGWVQVSPAHRFRTQLPHNAPKDTPGDAWWLAYQPVEFTVGNSYGTRQDLVDLCDVARKFGMGVIVDVCFNFMAALQGLETKEWNRAEQPGNKAILETYLQKLDKAYSPLDRRDFLKRSTPGKRRSNWFAGVLPAVDFNSSKVKDMHFGFMRELVECGVTGFRSDAILYTPVEVARAYVAAFPNVVWYLEVFEKRKDELIAPYQSVTRIEDFRPTMQLLGAFDWALKPNLVGDRKPAGKVCVLTLTNRLQNLDALVRPEDVVFAMNHDTERNASEGKRGIAGMIPANDLALQVTLMHATLFALKNGAPLVLNSLSNTKVVEDGLAYKRQLATCPYPATFVELDDRLLWMERGDQGVAVVNAGEKSVWIASLPLSSKLCGLYTLVRCEEGAEPSSFAVRLPIGKSTKKLVFWKDKSPRVCFPSRSACFYVLSKQNQINTQ
jgi:glycosidase